MDTQSFLDMFERKRSAIDDLPVEQLVKFYGALKTGDDDYVAAELRTLAKIARVNTLGWKELIESRPHFNFLVDVYDERGKWKAYTEQHNLVTREGLGYLIGCAFQVTSPASKKANFFVTQIKTNTTQNTTDTATTPGGTEIVMTTDVSQTVRPTLTLAAISTGADLTSCDNSASRAVFNHLTTITVYGLKLYSINAAGTSSGYTGDILYGGTLYATALAVANGYEVDVQATISATAG